MKRAIVFVMLAVFLVSVTSSTAFGALGAMWVPSVNSARTTVGGIREYSDLFGAIAKFEGTLQAYSVSGGEYLEEQVFLASDAISSSLEALNAELMVVYPNLSKEEQTAVVEAYSLLDSYLVDLADEANQIFLGDRESTPLFGVIEDINEISPNLPGRIWVGSPSAI